MIGEREVESDEAAAVERDVEHAIIARERVTELGMADGGDPYANERRAVTTGHVTAHHRDVQRVDGPLFDAFLWRIGAAVQERAGSAQVGSDVAIEHGREGDWIGSIARIRIRIRVGTCSALLCRLTSLSRTLVCAGSPGVTASAAVACLRRM